MPNTISPNLISMLGNLRLAGALILDQNNPDFPSNPKPGTLAVVGLNLYAYITVLGIQAWYPLVEQQSVGANYVHSQVNPSTVWTVHHNLNTPANDIWYQVQDTSYVRVDPASLEPIDNNSFILHFNVAQAGYALIVGQTSLIIDDGTIGDGTSVKITHTANQTINFVEGNGIIIAFDDNSKSITISTSDTTVSGDVLALQTKLNNVVNSIGLTTNGVYIPPSGSNYMDTASGLMNADVLLDAAIYSEKLRAQGIEASISAALTNETTNRISAYTTLITDLDAEVTNRSSAVSTLTANLSTETTNRTNAVTTLTTNLNNEIARAEGVESTLTTAVTTAQATANTAVTAVDGLATVASSGSYSDLSNKPTLLSQFTNDTVFQNLTQVNDAIQAVVGAAPTALATLAAIDAQLAADETAATSLVNTVSTKAAQSDLTAEIARAEAAESTLTTAAAAAQSTANTAATAISTEATNRTNAITTEAAARVAGDATNASAIAAETTRAEAAEAAINTNITIVQNTAISNILPLAYGDIASSTATTISTGSNQTLDSFDSTKYRSAKYEIQLSSSSEYQITELLCIHNGTTPVIQEITSIYTGSDYLASFDASISGGLFKVLVTPAVVGLTIKVLRSTIDI